MSAFRAFARDFFAAFDQAVVWQGERMHVGLSGPLRDFYGRDTLTLSFKPHDPLGDYVAYGSAAFEEMLAFLASRGRRAQRRLCAGPPPGPLRLLDGTASEREARPDDRRYYVFNYQLAFVSDERSERLIALCYDEAGNEAPDALAWDEAAPASEEPWLAPDALPVAIAARAEARAIALADAIARPLEGAIHERLARVVGRLQGYYEAQADEVAPRRRPGASEDDARQEAEHLRERLRQELARKLAEESARHQLRVQVRLVSRASFIVPGVWRVLALATPHAGRAVGYWENHHLGTSEWPPCERCGAAGPDVALCASGHLTCVGCSARCEGCRRTVCAVELAECGTCDASCCGVCLLECAGGHRCCATHLAGCVCCGQAFCTGCTAACPDCPPGSRLAHGHARPCGTCGQALCPRHVASGSCCAAGGGRGDRPRCGGCGERVGTGQLIACAQCDLPYCARCRDGGAHCRACSVVGGALAADGAWLAAVARVPGAADASRWTAIENEDYAYLLGRHAAGDVLLVFDRRGTLVRQVRGVGGQKIYEGAPGERAPE